MRKFLNKSLDLGHLKQLGIISLFILIMVFVYAVYASSNGSVTGKTSTTSSGCDCHDNQNTATTLASTSGSGSFTVATGSVSTFTISVTNSAKVAAGIDIGVKTTQTGNTNVGTLSIIAGQGLQYKSAAGELTHISPKSMVGGTISFQFHWTAPSTAGTYYLRAVGNAVDNTGDEAFDNWNWMPVRTITVINAAVAPVQINPANNQLNVAVNPTVFKWFSAIGATSYQLQVALDTTFTSPIINQSNITDTTININGLVNSTKYYWRLNSSNAAGSSPWSPVWNFTTIPIAPIAPILITPVNNQLNVSVNPSAFKWFSAVGAVTYQFQAATENTFTAPVINQSNITDTAININGLLNSTLYYWRVNSSNAAGNSPWSLVWNFTTVSLVDTLVLNLNVNWNLISSNVIPQDSSLANMFSAIANNINIMKNSSGGFWVPGIVNTIGNYNYKDGYQVSMKVAASMNILGVKVIPQNTPIVLNNGWKLIPYFRDNPMDVTVALASIPQSSITIVKNASGGFWVPGIINTLGNMVKGQGYWIYLSAPAVLTYPAN